MNIGSKVMVQTVQMLTEIDAPVYQLVKSQL